MWDGSERVTPEENDELTLTGPGTPAGRLLRRYWMPAALSEELTAARAVVAVRLMGEDLVLFRCGSGELGLIARACPHRGVDLAYGRLERAGLRCPFHGWCFDVRGQCLEQPAEPASSTMYQRVRTTAYPVTEHNGVVWAYLGPGAPPPLPTFDCFRAPQSHVFAFKGRWECNWLQATEIGIDPAHASYLHRFLVDDDAQYGQQFRDGVADGEGAIPMTRLLREYARPSIDVEETDFGLRILTRRDLGDGRTHIRVTNQIFPMAIAIPMSNDITITQWHVPIDDGSCYWYSMFTSFGQPVDKVRMREQRLAEHRLPDYVPYKNASNSYGFDAEEQRTATYTGMGMDINVHDQWAVESMGRIQDRAREHLASSDTAIVRYRRLLRRQIRALSCGPRASARSDTVASCVGGPEAIDAIAPSGSWRETWQASDEARRASCSWNASKGGG